MIALTPAFVLMQSGPSLTAQSPQAGVAREMTLTLPHALQKGETAWLLVEVGIVGHDRIQLTTQNSRPLGTISPFGVRSGQAAGTYTVPLPAEAFENGHLTLRLWLLHADQAKRAPTTEEVKSVHLVVR
jgi:hypothetical protein